MIRVLQELDVPVGSFAAVSDDEQPHTVEQMELRRRIVNDMDGREAWAEPVTWYRCGRIEVTPETDEVYWLQTDPPRRLRRR